MFSGVSMWTSYSDFSHNFNWMFAVPNDLDIITRAKLKFTFQFGVQLVKIFIGMMLISAPVSCFPLIGIPFFYIYIWLDIK